jgi:hypothetical protein
LRIKIEIHTVYRKVGAVYVVVLHITLDQQMEVQKKSYLCPVYNNSALSDGHNII